MVNNFTNSQTYKNLLNAFNIELIANGKYNLNANRARRDGYQQIGDIFDETSRNEQEHANIWLRFILQGETPTTLSNLQEAAIQENYEGTDLYLQYAETARQEGYTDIGNMFEGIAVIERHHYFRFNQLAQSIENNQVFCKPNSTVWVCMICGNLVWDECAPEICPICGYPQGYYEINCENY
jgi:rubrerythrin